MTMSLKDALDVQRASRWQKFQARKLGRKVCLGKETRPGWTGYLPFYLFKCPECSLLVKDYPHSWPERQHLSCPECGAYVDFVRFLTGVRMFFSFLVFLWRIKFSKKNDHEEPS